MSVIVKESELAGKLMQLYADLPFIVETLGTGPGDQILLVVTGAPNANEFAVDSVLISPNDGPARGLIWAEEFDATDATARMVPNIDLAADLWPRRAVKNAQGLTGTIFNLPEPE